MRLRIGIPKLAIFLLLIAVLTTQMTSSIFADDFKKDPVMIGLGDATSGGFAVIASTDQTKHKKVTFEVTNIGAFSHELIIIKTDVDPGALPLNAEGRVPEGEVDIIGRTAVLGGGESATLTFKLEKGNYALICNIRTHYRGGMFTGFQVGKDKN